MSAENGDRGSFRRSVLGPDTLRRLVGGSLGDPKTPSIMESLASMGRSLGPLVGESPPTQKTEDEEDY